jgi:hypothetical protein
MSLKQATTKLALSAHINAAVYIVACIAVAMQQQQDRRIFQGRFWAMTQQTR